jgi:hypothetical protein
MKGCPLDLIMDIDLKMGDYDFMMARSNMGRRFDSNLTR